MHPTTTMTTSERDFPSIDFDAIIADRIPRHSLSTSLDNSLTNTAGIHAVTKSAKANKFKKRLGAKKVKAFEKDAAGTDGLLKADAATNFRAVSARTNYLAQDRVDGSFSSKELCREFSQPNTLSLQKLKRLGRYYVGKPRLVYKVPFGKEQVTHMDVFVDTDFAGCSQTRRSTSGGCALINGRLIKHWSKTQPTIALSSGEAELIGMGQGMAQALGLQPLARDMNWELKINVHSDATAAIGIAKRRGLGKVRHLHTTDLWIQERVRNGDINLLKVLGTENPADALTKYLDPVTMNKALDKMGVHFMEGRAASAPAAMGIPAKAEHPATLSNSLMSRPTAGEPSNLCGQADSGNARSVKPLIS